MTTQHEGQTPKPDIKYWREVANTGRGSTMTACLHKACDFLEAQERENADLRQQLAAAEERTVERCAAIATKHWQEANSLRDSQVAGKIMRGIRALLKGKDNEQ